MADIFVSYAHQDRDWVRRLAAGIGEAGWSVWWDPKIPAGKTFRQVIEAELAAARCVVVVWSASALDSRWVMEEASDGLDRGILVPVFKERVRPPLGFRQLQCADLSEWKGDKGDARLQQLVEDIAGILGPPAMLTDPRTKESLPFPVPTLVPVPAGAFLMGTSDEDIERLCQTTKWARESKQKGYFNDEQPQHQVELDEYQIGKHPVTNAEYEAFVKAGGRPAPSHWSGGAVPSDLAAHPVVNVSWEDAVAYCQWLSGALRHAGRLPEKGTIRLPTEAEWEKAARGTDGRWYPWGNEWSAAKCNSDEHGIGATTPVGQFSPEGDSPYGLADMAGNVWEWCADWCAGDYYRGSPSKSPTGPEHGDSRVLRGGSWYDPAISARCAARLTYYPGYRDDDIGFRVVSSPF